MEKIKLMTDSAGDIPARTARELDIEIMHIPITVNGKGYFEGKDFTPHEFYKILLSGGEIPSTARINTADYLHSYIVAAQKGYTALINVTINAGGSGTHESAQMALQLFQKEQPALAQSMQVHILDSRTYSLAYGHAVMVAARRARDGAEVDDILDFLNDWLDTVEIFLACYNLDFAKKSGRIGSTSAFIGELLGLRPVVHMVEGHNEIIGKVRGDKNIVPTVCELSCKALVKGAPYYVMKGVLDEPGVQLNDLLVERLGYAPLGVCNLGPSISINAGPKVIATIVKGTKRK